MKNIIRILLIFSLINQNILFSQSTANYTFTSASNGSLTDMSSSTTQLIAASVDDGVSSVTNIGFDFVFCGSIYTQFSVNSNGLMRFGSSVISSTYSNNLTNGVNLPSLAPFWDDLAVNSTGKVHYKVTGSAPNRVLIVEWKDMEINYSSSTSNGTFQCRIYETSGIIEFIYGAMAIGSGSGSVTASIGFAYGTSNNQVLSVTSLSTPTVTTTAGSVVNNLINISTEGSITDLNSVADGSRVIYSFTPGSAPIAPSSLIFSAINMYGMTLSWTDNSSDETGFVIYRSTDGINYSYQSQVSSNVTTSLQTYLSSNTTYYYRIYALKEGTISATYISGSATTTSSAGNCVSIGTGNWNSTTTWSCGYVPTLGDIVTIADGHVVTIDATAYCNSLNIGQGVSGILQFEQTTARTLFVFSDVTINSGASLQSNTTGTQTGHILTLAGNLVNNGTLDFSTNSNTAGASITFTGATNNTFSGTGNTTDVRLITLNKGTSYSNVLELSTSNFTVQGVNTDVASFLTLTNGMFKISGNFTLTNRVFSSMTISSTCGFHLNNSNFTVASGASTLNIAGKLVVDNGIFNVGSATNYDLYLTGSGKLEINGGIVNVAESLYGATGSSVNYTQTGGIVNVCTVSNAWGGYGAFMLKSGSTFNMSGGSIIIRNPNTNGTATSAYDYYNLASTRSITGGTVQFGDASTSGAKTFRYSFGYFPALTINNDGGNHTVILTQFTAIDPVIEFGTTIQANTMLDCGLTYTCNPTFKGNVLVASGATLTHGTNTLTFNGDFSNTGTYTTSTGTAIFSGNASQNIGGSSTTNFYNLTNSNTSSGLVLTGNIGVSNTLSMNGAIANINLNGSIIDLGTTGSIIGESNSDRIYGSTGSVIATRNINNVTNYDVAGTGLYITTTANMGSTVFTRKHNDLSNVNFDAILRNFQISPTTNSGLNASITLNYFDNELNGLSADEDSFELWRSVDNASTWEERGGIESSALNTITLSSIDAFSLWTIGVTDGVVLSGNELSFNLRKNGEIIEVKMELPNVPLIESYQLETSLDGINFHPLSFYPLEDEEVDFLNETYHDRNFCKGINYYRVKTNLRNGGEEYSEIKSVNAQESNKEVLMYLNSLGQEVKVDEGGLIFIVFKDGSNAKMLKN